MLNRDLDFYTDSKKLINSFIWQHKKYIYLFDTMEDMQQELIMVLLTHIGKYNDKYKLSTFVYLILSNYCKRKMNNRYINKHRANFDILSYDDNEQDFIESMQDGKYDINFELNFNEIKKKISDITKDYIKGYRIKELAKKYKCSKMVVRKKIIRDRTIVESILK